MGENSHHSGRKPAILAGHDARQVSAKERLRTMLVWLLDHYAPLLKQMEILSTGDSRVMLTARTAIASVTSFLLTLLLGPAVIRWLKRRFGGEKIASDSERLNELHANKNSTPTMGGIFIMGSVVISLLMWSDPSNRFIQLAVFVVISMTLIGARDDWIKLSTASKGMSVRQKLVLQVIVCAITAVFLYLELRQTPGGTSLIWPLGNTAVALGAGLILWAMLVLVGTSNAVNLTDGLDGLASGCTIFAGSAFVAVTYLCGHTVMAEYLSIPHIPGSGELSVALGALVGAMLGFLWFNCYPAQVFMGDAGSLPIGGLLALAALVTRQEMLLVIIGGVFVVETLSVILQVGWFRLTGKRLIACSPLHNHFLFRGQHEIKIVTRFWIGSALLAIVGIASLKIR